MITVLPSELLKACDTGPSEQRRPLGKRSSRSHVSGTISVAAQRVCLNDPPSRTYEKIFATIPSDPQATFKILVKKCLDYDLEISSGQALLSEKSRALLDTVATTWRITVPFRNMVYFEALTALFSRGVITATALLEAGLSKANEIAVSSRHLSIPEVKLFRAACSVALPLLKHQLSTFLNHPLTTLHAQQLDAIITMMVSIQGNPTIDMGNADMAGTAKQVIVVALEARYHGLHAIAHSNQNARFAGLINLVQATREELELYRRHLSKKYFGFICIPDLAAEVFFHKLKPELDTFSKVYFASSSDLGDAFDLYKQVQSLIEVYDKMNYELAERFTVEDWFTPFLREWTLVTGRKFDEWMQRAISLDDFSFSDTTPYSTSVVDMFSSFQQQIEFILGLKWPNQAQEDAVLKCLIKDIALTLESYTHAMVKKMDEDFRTVGHTSSVVPPKSQSKDKRRKKMKIKLGKSKKLPDIDSCEIRVPQKACVKLNNIHALPELFAELCGRFSGIWPDHRPSCDIPNAPPAVPPKSRRHATPSRIPIRVTVLRGHRLQPTRPSTTLISCRLRCGNRTLGETTAVGQSPDASWETPCYFALGESEMPLPLEICLMHHMPDPSFAENAAKVFMFARGTTAVNWFSASGQEVLVDLGPSCGGIRVKCENMSDDETAFAKGLVESSVEHALHDGTLRLSDHVYNDLSARLKAVSKKYKRAALKKFLTKLGPKEKENSPPLGHTRKAGAAVAPSDEEIEQDLAPILSYINVNLEVLTENMEHELALVVAGHVWDRIVSGLETLVVGPSSNEEGKEHIGLDERRAQAVKKVANLLALFFHSDGEGLHEGRLLTPSFQQLLRLLDPSLRNEKDIIRRWEAAKAMDSLDSAIEDEGTPQLLRIRTSKELVDSSGARPPSGT
ncbi:hypothetical protein BC832DRAFT_564982 [Gaertneriomyces semiglobifer]|nr:hypothetical protein BC832DRAFT_564982 [Gaertneriomyces semiglobifer]